MTQPQSHAEVTEEDAFHFIVRVLRDNIIPDVGSSYGYDLYLPNIVLHYLMSVAKRGHAEAQRDQRSASPAFLTAAWELARRGVLRPGVKAMGQQATDEGSAGSGFSVTPAGRKWLKEAGQYDFVPIEPQRFSRLLDSFTPRFGPGFQERSQDAIRCYGANVYLACCAMCGAAAESILLAVAIAKEDDTDKVERLYLASGGRKKVENLLLGQQSKPIQEEFLGYMSLLKYWRDAAAHGRRSGIADNEAYTALAVLLRFAQFANDRWADLIGKASP
jgi:hypothetical protein